MTPNTQPLGTRQSDGTPTLPLEIAALGVVFGDIGTSPLYAFDLALKAAVGVPLGLAVLGILSMILWTLTIIVTIKYVIFVLRADNQGEGGILALVTRMRLHRSERPQDRVLLFAGMISAALIFGDGVLTPAISVLSAIEGLEIVAPHLEHYVVPIAFGVLLIFFLLQRFGTSRIGALFGPVMVAWFLIIGLLGLHSVLRNPSVLQALSPTHAAALLITHPLLAAAIGGAAFLAVTGAEALYADLGHFGRAPIRRAWILVAMPALMLSYLGQGAHALTIGKAPQNPFFELAPGWFGLPLLLLASVATVIASQAVLTGAFTLAQQASALGLLPPLRIVYTSEHNARHVFVPAVNVLVMIGTLGLVAWFKSSAALGSAYGIAVAGAMATTTVLLIADQGRTSAWPVAVFLPSALVFVAVDLSFLGLNLLKIFDGGWLPLGIAAVVVVVMLSWRMGRAQVAASQTKSAETLGTALKHFIDTSARSQRVLVFLTRIPAAAPLAMSRLTAAVQVVRQPMIVCHVQIVSRPRVEDGERLSFAEVQAGVWRAEVRYGYVEAADLPAVLEPEIMRLCGPNNTISYVVGTERIVAPPFDWSAKTAMVVLFAWLARNSNRSVQRFGLPTERTIEIGHLHRL